MAADSPAIPAPTTQTSVWISWSGAWTGLVTAVSFSSVRACGIDAPSGFKGEHGDAGGGASLQSFRSEARNVEAQVVIQFGNLHRDRAAVLAGQRAAAGETLVGALETLHGENGTILDHDRLADFEP